jgi:hypothetical protein
MYCGKANTSTVGSGENSTRFDQANCLIAPQQLFSLGVENFTTQMWSSVAFRLCIMLINHGNKEPLCDHLTLPQTHLPLLYSHHTHPYHPALPLFSQHGGPIERCKCFFRGDKLFAHAQILLRQRFFSTPALLSVLAPEFHHHAHFLSPHWPETIILSKRDLNVLGLLASNISPSGEESSGRELIRRCEDKLSVKCQMRLLRDGEDDWANVFLLITDREDGCTCGSWLEPGVFAG